MKIADGVYSLSQTKGGNVHAYIVVDPITQKLILIDTLADDDAGVVLDELRAMGRIPEDISTIALTHCHGSHVAGLAKIKKLSGAPVLAHEWEIPKIDGREKPLPVGYDLPRPFNLRVYALQLGLNAGLGKHTPVKVDGRLKDGDTVGPLRVMELPGHTPGCVGFWIPDKKVLIAGDTIATYPRLDAGWPTFDLDSDSALRSRKKMAELSDVRIVCVGHGDPIVEYGSDVLKELAK